MITEIAPGTYQGTDLTDLDYVITERFNAGQKVDLRLTIPRDLNADEIFTVRSYMEQSGLKVHTVNMFAPGELQVVFDRPMRPEGYALLPLVVLIIGALGAVGIGSLLGWQIGTGIKNNIVWIVLIIGAVVVLNKVVAKR